MRTLFLMLLMILSRNGFGQLVDGIQIDLVDSIQYVKINVADAGKFGKTRYVISVDYGQAPGNGQTFTILDAQGERRIWYSEMEAINYFARFGWELVFQTKTQVVGTNLYVDSYILKKTRK